MHATMKSIGASWFWATNPIIWMDPAYRVADMDFSRVPAPPTCEHETKIWKSGTHAYLQNMIDPPSVSQFQNFLIPVRCRVIIDRMGSAELLSDSQLRVRGRCGYNSCSGCNSKLQTEAVFR